MESNTEDSPSAAAANNPNQFGPKLRVIPCTDQIRELQTLIRDKETTRSHFKFVADRLIRMVIEAGLNELPYSDEEVITPTGCKYTGLRYEKGSRSAAGRCASARSSSTRIRRLTRRG
jgi:uracil phosphoribosyltransferase